MSEPLPTRPETMVRTFTRNMMFVGLLLCVASSTQALQLNLYTSIGQVRQEIVLKNGQYETYFSGHEYHALVPGTIDFPGQKMLEQDLYSSTELLRQTEVFVRLGDGEKNATVKSKIIDPYRLLVKYDSSRYGYVSRDQIEFKKDPQMNGMILSVRLNDTTLSKTTMTYLTRSISWMPRYEVIITDEQAATIRALADLTNELDRSFDITHSQLMTGNVPLAASPVRLLSSNNQQSAEHAASHSHDAISPISPKADSTNFGTYSYNITRTFTLFPKSIKTFPFLTPKISFNYTLEGTTYLSAGSSTGLFQRVFIIQCPEFLPAGIVTFYLGKTGTCLGQGRLADTSKRTDRKITLDSDPDVKYTIKTTTVSTQTVPPYEQELDVHVTIVNRKDKQSIPVTLTIPSRFRQVTLTQKKNASSSISIGHDENNKATLVLRAVLKPDKEESCSFNIKQSY